VSGLEAVVRGPIGMRLPFELMDSDREVVVARVDLLVRLVLRSMERIRREFDPVWIWMFTVVMSWVEVSLQLAGWKEGKKAAAELREAA